jgi:hydroxypyruvate reductase
LKRGRARRRFDRLRLRRAAAAILAAGLKAADPADLVRRSLRLRGGTLWSAGVRHRLERGRIAVVAAGKAAATMASAAEEVLGERIACGLAVDTSSTAPLRRVRLRLAGHPIPDERGAAAAAEVEALAQGLGADDLLLLLLSGGASALLPAPVAGISLDDKARATRALLRAGANIGELNTVRKHLSRLKGGGLARAAAPARLVCLVLSDVVGDDLSTIASGPAVADPTTFADALAVLRARGVLDAVSPAVKRHLEAGARGEAPETPKPGDPVFRRVVHRVVGSNRLSLEAAARRARREGLRPLVLTTRLEGESREVALALVGILRECVESGRPAPAPVCLLAGGETTVTVQGEGRGGRNQELVVAAVPRLAGFPSHAVVASLATDGVDGASDAAGGVADQESAARALGLGLAPPAVFLSASDSHAFLAPLADLIVTGPTGTNVVDLTLLMAGDPVRERPARGSRNSRKAGLRARGS